MTDRLRELLEAAARGSFPPPVWGLDLVPAPATVAAAVVAFTAHHVIAAGVGREEIGARLAPADFAAPFNPSFLAWLGERIGARAGHVDVVLACPGGGRDDRWLLPLADQPEGERAARAASIRRDVEFLAPREGGGLVTLGRGLAGRWELSMEVDDEAHRNRGLGRRLVAAAVDRVPADEFVFATVSPGNARSLRCLLGCGFTPIGAECLFAAA